MINANQSIGEIARTEPATIEIFESLGIQFCCHGELSIDKAAESSGVTKQDLLGRLVRAAESNGKTDPRRWVDPILDALMKHLTQSRKNLIGSDLPRINALARSVAEDTDRALPNTSEVLALTEALVREVEAHAAAEVGTLYPMIRNVEIAYVGINVVPVPPKRLRHTVGRMVHEHEEIGFLLSSIHRLTDGYQEGNSKDSSYWALCRELELLDRRIREQVHLENNVLFNRALQFSRML